MSPKLLADNAISIAEFLQHSKSQAVDGPSNAYQFAFMDHDFLASPETRGIRFQLELLKPEVAMKNLGVDHTITVFGSARCISKEAAERAAKLAVTEEALQKNRIDLAHSENYEAARSFGRLVAQYNLGQTEDSQKLRICTGGGPGIIEAANRGASEMGDLTVGLNISLPKEQTHNPYITPELCFRFHYFALRKMHFLLRARAIVAFAGGFGTMDELFEVLTLIQTRKINAFPVVLVNKAFWSSVINFQGFVDNGLIDKADLALFHLVDTPEDAWKVIYDWYDLGNKTIEKRRD